MTNYKEKYFKYKLKYLKLKGGKIINGGGAKFDFDKGTWVATSKTDYSDLEAQIFNKYCRDYDKCKGFMGALQYVLININEDDIGKIKTIYNSRHNLDEEKTAYLEKLEKMFPGEKFLKRKTRIEKHKHITKLYESKLDSLKDIEKKETFNKDLKDIVTEVEQPQLPVAAAAVAAAEEVEDDSIMDEIKELIYLNKKMK